MKNIFRISGVILLIILIHSCKKDDVTNIPKTISDNDGNIYNTITIGTQTWMKENLKTTKYNNGTSIPAVWDCLSTGAYCWYNNDAATYKAPYGALYNWYAVNTGKLCPTGWHVPSDAEWTTLTTFLGGEDVAGGKLKEFSTGQWNTPNIGATNETGFTALPGGHRVSSDIGSYGYWWSSTEYITNIRGDIQAWAWVRILYYKDSIVGLNYESKCQGFSVRCLRDN